LPYRKVIALERVEEERSSRGVIGI
jgi:hypothetical protein